MQGQNTPVTLLVRGAPVVDVEGRVTYNPVEVPLRASVHGVRATEVAIAAQAGQRLETIARVPLDFAVKLNDQLRIDAGPFAGLYDVVTVNPTRLDQRIGLSRSQPPQAG